MNDELYHWGLRRGEQKKDHKYTKRELIGTSKGKNKYRYFYENVKKKVKDAFSKLFNKVDETYSEIKELTMSDAEKKAQFYKDYYSGKNNKAEFNWDKVRNKHEKLRKSRYITQYNSSKNEAYGVGLLNSNEEAAKKYGKQHKYVGKVKLPNGKYRYFYDSKMLEAYYEKYGTDTEKELMHKYGLKSRSFTQAEDMFEINEARGQDLYLDFGGGKRYKAGKAGYNNCAYCTLAYDLRRRGFDVEAPNIDGMTTEEEMSLYTFEDYERGGIYKSDPYTSATALRRQAKYVPIHKNYEKWTESFCYSLTHRYQDGDRGFVNPSWKNGGAHAMAWEVIDGEPTIIDCQTGSIYRGPDEIKNVAKYMLDCDWFDCSDRDVTPQVVEWTRKNTNRKGVHQYG